MEESYVVTMHRLDNQCRENMRKADIEYAQNGRHTKDECIYLQRAARCCQEMAAISVGEEKRHYEERIFELNDRIRAIAAVINPSVAKDSAKGASGSGSSKGGSSKGGSAQAKGDNDIDSSGWFKEKPGHSFEDVSGMEDLKQQLKERISDSGYGKLREYMQLSQLISYFFYGPPGTGKTYIIEAFVYELMEKGYRFMSLNGADILSKYVGDAEKIVQKMFDEARDHAPCILFIDEIDGVCRNRSQPNLPEYAASITTSFLIGYNELVKSNKQVIFIGATNYPAKVDSAMLDRVNLVRVPLPDEKARASAFTRKFGKFIQMAPDFSAQAMAEATDNYNYRDIDRLTEKLKHLILRKLSSQYTDQEEAIRALKEGQFVLSEQLFEEARRECVPSPKDQILKELDEWDSEYTKRQDE